MRLLGAMVRQVVKERVISYGMKFGQDAIVLTSPHYRGFRGVCQVRYRQFVVVLQGDKWLCLWGCVVCVAMQSVRRCNVSNIP